MWAREVVAALVRDTTRLTLGRVPSSSSADKVMTNARVVARCQRFVTATTSSSPVASMAVPDATWLADQSGLLVSDVRRSPDVHLEGFAQESRQAHARTASCADAPGSPTRTLDRSREHEGRSARRCPCRCRAGCHRRASRPTDQRRCGSVAHLDGTLDHPRRPPGRDRSDHREGRHPLATPVACWR